MLSKCSSLNRSLRNYTSTRPSFLPSRLPQAMRYHHQRIFFDIIFKLRVGCFKPLIAYQSIYGIFKFLFVPICLFEVRSGNGRGRSINRQTNERTDQVSGGTRKWSIWLALTNRSIGWGWASSNLSLCWSSMETRNWAMSTYCWSSVNPTWLVMSLKYAWWWEVLRALWESMRCAIRVTIGMTSHSLVRFQTTRQDQFCSDLKVLLVDGVRLHSA